MTREPLQPFAPSEFSTDVVVQMKEIDRGAQWLDWLTKALDEANHRLDEAEATWDDHYDKVADDLKDEMEKHGRKGDPAEHWIESVARKQNRVAYQNLRRAKRLVEKLERQMRAASSAMNGRQSNLGALRDEMRAPQPPDWARQRTVA